MRQAIGLVSLVVTDYDEALDFYVGTLSFELVEDSPSSTNDGRPKRWVVVRPPGGATGILLARADGERQASAVGDQMAGRVGFFLRVDDFDAAYRRMTDAGVAAYLASAAADKVQIGYPVVSNFAFGLGIRKDNPDLLAALTDLYHAMYVDGSLKTELGKWGFPDAQLIEPVAKTQ